MNAQTNKRNARAAYSRPTGMMSSNKGDKKGKLGILR